MQHGEMLLWRFIKHCAECLVIVEKDFFRVWRLLSFTLPILALSVPWLIHSLSPYAWWFWGLGIASLLFRAFCHSFKLYDDLNEKTKPKLQILDSDPVDSTGHINRVWQIRVKTFSSAPIEQCSARLVRIERAGVQEWGGQNVSLAFQPNDQDDATSKTIMPETTEYLDVIFWDYSSNQFFPGTKVGKRLHAWIFARPFHLIFSIPGDYELTIQITAKDMRTETKRLKFTNNNAVSELVVLADAERRSC